MYSMNYIGKFIANFREFYNEINGATLTGAIDVVVVEQPDGSFTCSPFHVRFGKLGVLRSRFKVVDLELNGEPLNIHMKLGESGEAFFVEEVPEDEVEWSAHLATSPIPDTRFEELYEPPRRRNSISVGETSDRAQNEISDYSQRRYTDSTMEKPDFSKISKEYHCHKEDDSKTKCEEHEALFEMEGLDDVGAGPSSAWGEGATAPKTFAAARVDEPESEANQAVRKISVHNDFRPIADAPTEDIPQDDVKNGNGKKKKKTKKAGSKKKHQRKSSSSSNGYSSQSERAGSEARQTPAGAQSALAPPAGDINFFSDSELAAAATRESERRGDTPVQSDTELELARGAGGADKRHTQSWRWGELPEPPPRAAEPAAPPSPPSPLASPLEPLSSDEERTARRGVLSNMFGFMKSREDTGAGVYLADLAEGQIDPDLYFPKHHTHAQRTGAASGALRVSLGGGASEEEYESGNGPSLPQSPASLEPPHLDSDDDDKLLTKGCIGVYIREDGGGGTTVSRAVSYEEFISSPGDLLASPRLLVRVGDKRVPWSAAGPLLLSLLAYRRPLPSRVLESLATSAEGEARLSRGRSPTPETKSRGYSWWSWRRTNPQQKSTDQTQPSDGPEKSPIVEENVAKETTAETAAPNSLKPGTDDLKTSVDPDTSSKDPAASISETGDLTSEAEPVISEAGPLTSEPATLISEAQVSGEFVTEGKDEGDGEDRTELEGEGENSLEDSATLPVTGGVEALPRDVPWSPASGSHPRRVTRRHSTDRFRKTLRLSSDQIASLNLKEGINEMVFSVTTAYQGTTRCKCNLFLWRHDDKVVISDIDGTITKSDVLGHIFPLVGKDWAQSGVAQLFTKIKNNGYKLLYLSARAIGQAKVTREYLRSIRQGEVSLPDGPLLLNPTSLLRAFHREVIEKKPEEFKIQCLADIKALFPQDSNPFYAGYGNRVNDVCAYQAVGIPIVRIFTINYRGELKHELTQTFQSTYSHMSVLVDQVFPPCLLEPCDDFSQAVYWREPLPTFDLTLPTILETQH